MKKYLNIENEELNLIFYISLSVGFMFATSFHIWGKPTTPYPMTLILFIVFLFLLFFLRNKFMKFIGYRNGFEIKQIMTSFDRYGFRNFDRISYYANKDTIKLGIKNPIKKSSGKIPLPVLNVVIYILTLGIIIWPSMWRYKIKKIPHKFIGSQQKYDEVGVLYYMHPLEITRYRYGKALFGGYLFYLIFALILKVIYNMTNSDLIALFIFMVFWIAFTTLIPMIGTEGYELFSRARIAWVCANTLLFLGLLSILIFKRLDYVVITTAVSFVILFVYMFWKEMILK